MEKRYIVKHNDTPVELIDKYGDKVDYFTDEFQLLNWFENNGDYYTEYEVEIKYFLYKSY